MEVGVGCCVALYVMAQCDRKAELNHEAESKFISLERLVDVIEMPRGQDYPCTASRTLKCLCNRDLLRASVGRARGVVARRLGQLSDARRYFDEATSAANRALASVGSVQPGLVGPAELASAYDRSPFEVLADVHYSHGYFWYEQRDAARATTLFEQSIKALAAGGAPESWDAPYTRLAIVHLLSGDLHRATTFGLRARNICKSTPPGANREAPLSLALNTLALRVIEAKTKARLLSSEAEPMRELQLALDLEPPLTLGPLVCHRKDATLILTQCDDERSTRLATEFIECLQQAELDVYAAQRRSGRD